MDEIDRTIKGLHDAVTNRLGDIELWNPDTVDGARRLRTLWAMLQDDDDSEQGTLI